MVVTDVISVASVVNAAAVAIVSELCILKPSISIDLVEAVSAV